MTRDGSGNDEPTITNDDQDVAGNYANAYTTALLAEKEGRLGVAGSGVLFKVFTEHAILTAGHVAVQMRAFREGRLFARNPATGQIWLLEKVEYAANEREPADVGLIWMPHDLGLRLGAPENYLDLDQIDSTELSIPGRSYLVAGFPQELYLQELRRLRILRYLTRGYAGQRGELKAFDPSSDLLLSHHPEPKVHDGVDVAGVSRKGMSGGGIWRFFAPGASTPWTPQDLRLVGLQHEHWKRPGILRGSRIGLALRLAAESRPDLSVLLRQHHPSAFGT